MHHLKIRKNSTKIKIDGKIQQHGQRLKVHQRFYTIQRCGIENILDKRRQTENLYSQEPLKTKFNWNASTNKAELVLEGKYTDDDLTTVQRLFLDHLQRVTPTDKFDEKVKFSDFKRKMKLWRETTSTSPSGRHLGHYKVIFTTID